MAQEVIDRDFCIDRRNKILKEYNKILIGLDETGQMLIEDLLSGLPY